MYSLYEIEQNLINDYIKITDNHINESNRLIKDLYMDSLEFVELLIATEERYSFEFEDDKYFKDAFETLSDIANYAFHNQNNQQ